MESFMKKVITYGTFDLLHWGHIRLLERARELGDHLTVVLSTDEFNRLKGRRFFINMNSASIYLRRLNM